MSRERRGDVFRPLDTRFQLEQHVADRMEAAHWHDHIEVNLLQSGEMTYLINGRTERVAAGNLVLFWAAIPHRAIEVTPHSALICSYLPLADFLALPIRREVKQLVLQGGMLAGATKDPTDLLTAARWVEQWSGGDEARRRLVTDEVKLRIRRLAHDSPRSFPPAESLQRDGDGPAASVPLDRVQALIELINRHHADDVSPSKLADLAAVHPSTANRAFRAVLGLSMNEYLIRYRLAQAMHLLADTDRSILQVAYACGFGTSRFYEVFKARVGVAPKQFRARVRGVRPESAANRSRPRRRNPAQDPE
ncbi:helix-turn-helix domain-containing protein [Consotaella aegiceratis]|uniref:helix-turn-helix domain-containing protein n=1 Tax=Consotaella aegiceratis TaxID=3097961 RepID=UPI002F407893